MLRNPLITTYLKMRHCARTKPFHFEPPILRGTVRRAIPIVRHAFRCADGSLFENLQDAFLHMCPACSGYGGGEHAGSEIQESQPRRLSIYSTLMNVRRRATRAATKCLNVDALPFLMLPFAASRIS